MMPNMVLYNEKLAAYGTIPMSGDEKETYTKLKQLSAEYFDIVGRVNSLTLEGKDQEAATLRNEKAGSKRAETMKEIQNLVRLNNESAYQYYTDSGVIFNSVLLATLIITVVCAIILLTISWFIIRNLTRRFDQLLRGMDEVGGGNLSYRIGLAGSDEIAHIGSSFDAMTRNLEKQTDEIHQNLERSKQANAAIMETAHAVKNGNIDAKIETAGFTGEFLVTVQSVNDLVDAFIHPLKEAMSIVNRFASGDFTPRFDKTAKVKGEFEKFRYALDNSAESVSGAIKGVKDEVESLNAVMEETNASVEEVAGTASVLAQNSSSVSDLAERSSTGISQILAAMDDLSKAVSSIASAAEDASSKALQTVELSEKGLTLAGQAENGMNGIMHSFEETQGNIIEITSQMDEIGKILEIITGISEQTGLLALNAAIEAARAGDAGRGFAVVADEVKSLALESQRSAENIASIIGALQKKSKVVSDSMKDSVSEVKEGTEAVGKTLDLFKDIVRSINGIHVQLTGGASASEEQAATVEEITASVHEIEGLIQKTAKEAMDSAAATEQVTASLDQITKAINEATGSIQRITKEMGGFTVS
jgi:methyl-accepting chemotaxis protein